MWNRRTTASSIHFTDLPFELQYRWINQKDTHFQPIQTTILGMIFPTGILVGTLMVLTLEIIC